MFPKSKRNYRGYVCIGVYPAGPKEPLFGLLYSLFAWVRPCYMGSGVTAVCVCVGGGGGSHQNFLPIIYELYLFQGRIQDF